jgi:HAD superfamily hydrolase (TIGR01458 family)
MADPRPAPPGAMRGSDLEAVVDGVTALLVDVDGVLVLRGQPIPGAAEALRSLDRVAIPYLLATNTSLYSRAALAAGLGERLGVPIEPARVHSALSAAAALTARRFAGQPLLVLASRDAATEFVGQDVIGAETDGESAAAVVIGDAPEALTYENLDRAFRLIRKGARLVAMHRNRWWLTARGPTLDAGAYVRALEYATGRRALLAGKPAPSFFRAACQQLGWPPGQVLMVGDDPVADVAGARRAGLRAVLALSGKSSAGDALQAASDRSWSPDAMTATAPDLGVVAEALLAGRRGQPE